MARSTAGRDLEQPAGCGTGQEIHQPEPGGDADLEGYPATQAHRWRTQADGGDEEGGCGEEGQPQSTAPGAKDQQDGPGDRVAATARGSHTEGHHEGDRL